MSIRNTKSANKGGALTVNGTPYTLARSDVFYFLKFIDYDKELFKSASNLTAKPTAVFYTEDAQDKVILDYSLANETDKTYLASFFANMTQTDTFNFTNGSYLDKAELEANIGCTLTYSAFKDSKIFANVNAVTSKNAALDVYFGDYFLATPQLSKAGGLGSSSATVNYALVSVNPNTNKPLSSLGITHSDIIEVVSTDADNNQIKFEITEISTINEKEVLKIKPTTKDIVPTLESLLGLSSLVNVYVKGITTLPQQLSGDLGCCFGTFGRLDNNTEYQCNIRENDASFIVGLCSDIPVTSINPQVQQFTNTTIITTDNINAAFVANSNIIFDASIENTNDTIPILKLQAIPNNTGASIDNLFFDNKIFFQNGASFAFAQTNASNYGYIIRFSTTENEFTPYVEGIFGNVSTSGINTLQFTDTNLFNYPKILYIYLQKTIPGTKNTTYTKTNYSCINPV